MPVIDPTLPHQVVIHIESGGPHIFVSCNCLVRIVYNNQQHESMGRVKDYKETMALYNNPENHNKNVPFGPEDKLSGRTHKWRMIGDLNGGKSDDLQNNVTG